MNIAFVLLTRGCDEPAGVERAIAVLADGLREIGHRAVLIAGGPPGVEEERDLVLLASLRFDELPRLFEDPQPVCREVREILIAHDIDVVCWADAVAGLGFLSPAAPGVRTALMVRNLRMDDHMRHSLAQRPDAVLAVSPFLIDEAAQAGMDTTGWHALPDALPTTGRAPGREERERLRRIGPVRILTRADPAKGSMELLDALPESFGRPVQLVLAETGLEPPPEVQADVVKAVRSRAAACPNVEVLHGLPWPEVQPFLAEAAVTLAPSTRPETFNDGVAASLSVGTPVVGYDFGHLPLLVGGAGRLVPLDALRPGGRQPLLTGRALEAVDFTSSGARLWRTATELLDNAVAYHAAAAQALHQVADHSPTAVAERFLRITNGSVTTDGW
ncbi:glycosyltransferase [Streptomyces iranensis]|uniref:Iron(II)-dependent oxidoreductase n=1 Tax=Streptomyces iranensis TaxID=576784 RepID=A0A060ZZW8_9ACTN|nr:glycosyltransferase [Streptomyces iranensis]MBP2066187.1 iron(II)-dependent oxidoreductase [Streptomyces iranensis]CDR13081.1 predicted protein [Streptomyces iranensis]